VGFISAIHDSSLLRNLARI